jgi:uncharacterized membrane protein
VSPSEHERLDRLEQRQEELERRLAQLEGVPRPAPVPSPVVKPERPRAKRFEARTGMAWINRIGAVTLALGAAFFFNYAVEAGWLGVSLRVLLGVATGSAFLIAADWLSRQGQRTFAQGLGGAGVAILYLSFWAAWRLYHLVPYAAAFVLMAAATVAAIALSIRCASEAIAALGFLGGYVTPLLLWTGEDRPWFLLGYLLLLGAGARYVAQRREWRWVVGLAFAATAVLYTAGFRASAQRHMVNTVSALAYYALFAGVETRLAVYAAHVLAAVRLAVTWPGQVGPFGALALVLAAAGRAVAQWRRWPAAQVVVLAGGAGGGAGGILVLLSGVEWPVALAAGGRGVRTAHVGISCCSRCGRKQHR